MAKKKSNLEKVGGAVGGWANSLWHKTPGVGSGPGGYNPSRLGGQMLTGQAAPVTQGTFEGPQVYVRPEVGPMSGGKGFNYSSGNIGDPTNQMLSDQALMNQKRLPLPGAATEDATLRALFNRLLEEFSGPAPTMAAFNTAPYDAAIANINQQVGLGQQAIARNTQDFDNRLGQLSGQFNQRSGEDAALLQSMQNRLLGQAQAGVGGIAADLQSQGINPAAFQAQAGNRVGALQDIAGLQNITANRSAENARNTLGATQAGAAGTAAGALNTLSQNAQQGVGQIGMAQAKAAQSAQDDYYKALTAYQNNRGGAFKSALDIVMGVGGGDDDPVAGEYNTEIATRWAGKPGTTASELNDAFNSIAEGLTTPEDLLGTLAQKDPKTDKTGWDELTAKGVDVPTFKAALREYAKGPKKATKSEKRSTALKGIFG